MNRRHFLSKTAALTGAFTGLAAAGRFVAGDTESNSNEMKKAITSGSSTKLNPPKDRPITVAILVSEGVNVIDFSGPWGVFESVMVPDAHDMPFHLFAVADSTDFVASGSGLKIKPD